MERRSLRIIIQVLVLLFIISMLAGCVSKSEYAVLDKRTTALEKKNSELQIALDRLNSKVSHLESQTLTPQPQSESVINSNGSRTDMNPAEIIEERFTFYYVPMAAQRFGVDDLKEYLQRWKWSKGAYNAHQFDCSEMSAILEWKLENECYHTVILVGDMPGGEDKHAWLLVETTAGHYLPVDAITFDIIDWQDNNFADYFRYDYYFETIQDALAYGPTEFDWWN